MDVYGFNFKLHDIWARQSNNVFKINGLKSDEWVAAGNGTYEEFWNTRTQRLTENFNRIWANSANPSSFPLDGLFRMLGSTNNQAVLQTANAMGEWEKFAQIKTNGGKAIGFDLETFGAITKPGTDAAQFGITEFAFGTRTYNGTETIGRNGRSYIFGINDDQYKYLMSLVDKFEATGWDSLDERNGLEQTSLSRMSMYSSKRAIKDEIIDGKTFKVAGELASESRTAEAFRAGIENLHNAYKVSKPQELLPMLIGKLTEAAADENTVLFGANSKYDIDSIMNTARVLGIDASTIDEMRSKILDIVYSARALAANESMSVDSYFEKTYGVRTGASVDEQLQATRIDASQIHRGDADLENEGRLLDIRVQEVIEKQAELQKMTEQYRGNLDDSVFLVNRGALNHQNAQDMAIVDGKPVANYSFTNEYWTVDKEHSNYVDLDGEQKYVLTLDNLADEGATKVALVYNSEDEAFETLARSSSIFTQAQVTKTDAINQQEFKYRDFGRREFDKLINPINVGMDGKENIYGFETLQQYLKFMDEMPDDLVIEPTSDSAKALFQYVQTHYTDESPSPVKIKSYYQAQAFVGMYDKLANEKDLLKQIVAQVENIHGNANNMDKTIDVYRAYTNAISYLDTHYERKQAKDSYAVMSDVLGIDVELPDKSIQRINGYNASTIAYDVQRIFKPLSIDDVKKVLNDMHDRGLFTDDEAYKSIVQHVATMSSDDLYGVSQDIGYELSKYMQSYSDMDKSIVHAFQKSAKSKNKQLLGQKLETDTIIKYQRQTGKKALTFDKVYNESADTIQGVISDAITSRPETYYVDTNHHNKEVLTNHINAIAEKLNIAPDSDESKLLVDLFTKTTNAKGEPTSYAFNNYLDKGLRTFIAQSDEGNAYLFMTREQDMNRFYSALMGGKFDLSNRYTLIDPGKDTGFESINDYASFIEIPKINEYELSDGVLRTITQGKAGEMEKIIIPELQVRDFGDGRIGAYYNSGEYGFLSTIRMANGNAIEHALHGEYKAGTDTIRRAQNAYLDGLSASASYRGRIIEDSPGKYIVKRVAEFTPSDYIQSSQVKLTEGLYSIFKTAVAIDPAKDLNAAQQVVQAFGKASGLLDGTNRNLQDSLVYIANDTEFKEFFMKRLFTGTVASDISLQGRLSGPEFDKNIFQIINETVTRDTTHTFDKSVGEALQKINTQGINQVLSESASDKGIVSYKRPGDYNDAASLYSTLRPTYHQQNNGLLFTPNEIDASKFRGLEEHAIRIGTTVITEQEYSDKMALAESGYQPIPGQDYAERERTMIAKVKQMNDYDLITQYQTMESNSAAMARELGISESRYNKALEYFEQEFMSLHEGKLFIAPGLNEQDLFTMRDGKKVLFNKDIVDEERSRKILNALVHNGTKVDRDTIIAVTPNGAPIYYDGPDTVFTHENITDFFDRGRSTVIPFQGDIFDNKIMINGAEKGTTHSINMTKFMEYTGFTNHDEALRVANSLFTKMSDGAAIIGNLGLEGHGNITSTHSLWNTITSVYTERGEGQALVNQLNRMITEAHPAFRGVGKFQFKDGHIISSSGDAHNFSYAIETLYDQIANNTILSSDTNQLIVKEVTEMQEKKIFNAWIQRQNMNEHMGTRMVYDQRIEQGIRTRGMQIGGTGMDPIDNQWADTLKYYAEHYNATGTGLKDDGYGYLQEYVDVYGKSKNANRIHLLSGKTDVQRSAKGIVESIMYYYNPSKYGPEGKNIVTININDIIDESSRLKGGMTTKELRNSIFFVDGKPSDFLQKAARKSGVNLYDKSYSIAIDLNTTFNIKDKFGSRTFNRVMIPVQSVFTDINDKTYFQSQQATIARFVNQMVDITTNPGKYKKTGIKQALSNAYSKTMGDLTKQLGYLDKDSDIYKAFQQYIMPNSQELLAQDEASPLVKSMLSDEMKKLKKEKERLEGLIKINPDNKVAIKELDEVHTKLKGNLSAIAKRILEDDSYYSELMSLNANKNLREAAEVMIDGKKQYGLAVAISKEAFERQGISVGAVGLQAFSDWETGNYQLERIKEFSQKHNFARRKTTIARRLNELGIEGLTIDSSQSITKQLNEFVKNKYDIDGSMLSTKDLNKAIINSEHGSILKVFDEEIGTMFLSEVGTFGEITRYPTFRSQAMTRVILDTTLTGTQVRGSSAVFSSLNNVDFDGDKLFLTMPADGVSIVKTNTVVNGVNIFDTATTIFNRFAERESRQLLAELVDDIDLLNVDDPNASTRQYAAMLKKMKPDMYESAVMSWAKDNSIRVASVDDLSDAQLFAAHTSKQMHDTFINMKFNTMTDEDSIIASIASRFRKKNIGSISTPNYTMRNALLEALQDPSLSLTQKQILNDAYVSLSNMKSKAGGFFSAAEQKSIDVKHASDGLKIAKTARYSTGMATLFGKSKHTRENNIKGVRNILEAVNSGLFKASEQELHRMASQVVDGTVEGFSKEIQEAAAAGKKTTELEYLQSLRRLLDVQKEIPNFDKYYVNKLIHGSLDESIYKTIEDLNEKNLNELSQRYVGTGFFNALDVFADSFSAKKEDYKVNNVYFQIGDIYEDWQDKAFLYKGNNRFAEIDILTGKETGGKIKTRQTLESILPQGINVRDYMEQTSIREQASNALTQRKFEKTLNSVLLDKDGKIRSGIPDSFIKVGNAKGGLNKYGSAWTGVNQLFVGSKSAGRQTSAIYANINSLARTYDYAVSKGYFDTKTYPSSSGELIKQLNKQIAENPRSRDAENGFIFSEEYDTILRKKLISTFQNEEILERYATESQLLSNLDTKKYQETLDFLKENTYDIIEEQRHIQGSFAKVQVELEGLQNQGVSDEQLKPLQTIIDSSSKRTEEVLTVLRKENQPVIHKVQQDVYSLFGSTTQMDYFFGWNRASNDSIVGFGNYIGKRFGSLTASDIQAIQEAGALAQQSIKTMTNTEIYAMNHTLEALKNYKPVSYTSARDGLKTAVQVNDLIAEHDKAITAVHDTLEKRTPEQVKEASERAAKKAAEKGIKKKTLSGSLAANVKGAFDKIPKKTLGIAVGSLAALGIANNLLHNEKQQSPLTPARRPDSNDRPDTRAPKQTQAPVSKQRTVYHDNASGFNFKVSAKTQNYINEMNNAKLIGMSGGGNTSVYNQSDTSGVTDNWLANKFAELT